MITNKEKEFISAVVYVNNNENNVTDFLEQLHNILTDNFEKFEIICVNDASTDKSTDCIKKQSEKMENSILSIVNMSFYQGLEMSMNAGVDLAIGDFVFEFDSTIIDYLPALVMDVYYQSLKGYDIVSASNSKKRFTSSIFYKVYNKSSGTQYKLDSENFRILSRRAINRVHSLSKTLPYRKALYSNCGLKICTIPYQTTANVPYPHTKQQKKNQLETALNSLILFTDVAYKVSIGFTILMMLATIFIGIYVITVFLLGLPVPGFTPIMLTLTGSFFGVFAILAIIIKYLSILVDLVFKRQKYIIESIEKITK